MPLHTSHIDPKYTPVLPIRLAKLFKSKSVKATSRNTPSPGTHGPWIAQAPNVCAIYGTLLHTGHGAKPLPGVPGIAGSLF